MVGDGGEIVDEFQKPVGFAVLEAVLGDAFQYGFGVVAEHCEFHQVGRVEHHVGGLLVGVYPFMFALADIGPLAYGFFGGEN